MSTYKPAKRLPNGDKAWVVQEIRTSRWIRVRDIYCRMVIERGFTLTRDDFDRLGKLYRPDVDIPRATLLRLLKQREAMRDVSRRLSEMLTQSGLGPDKQLGLLKRAVDLAEDSDKVGDVIKAHDKLNEYHRLTDDAGMPEDRGQSVLEAIMVEDVEDAVVLGLIEDGNESADHAEGVEGPSVVREDSISGHGSGEEPEVSPRDSDEAH